MGSTTVAAAAAWCRHRESWWVESSLEGATSSNLAPGRSALRRRPAALEGQQAGRVDCSDELAPAPSSSMCLPRCSGHGRALPYHAYRPATRPRARHGERADEPPDVARCAPILCRCRRSKLISRVFGPTTAAEPSSSPYHTTLGGSGCWHTWAALRQELWANLGFANDLGPAVAAAAASTLSRATSRSSRHAARRLLFRPAPCNESDP
jgi:hypothetical protein